MSAALFGHVGAGDPHGDADIGALERGRVVDAVSGHGDDVALALERAHDAQLVLRVDAGEHPHLLDDRVELAIRHGAQLGAGDEPRSRLEYLQLPGNCLGGRRVVAGDHDRADVRPLGGRDGDLRFRARGVDHADHPEQHEIVLGMRFRKRRGPDPERAGTQYQREEPNLLRRGKSCADYCRSRS
jgi:hypothetical protein